MGRAESSSSPAPPGAFTDLAADLSYALGGIPVDQASPAVDGVDQRRTRVDGQRRVIELDADLRSIASPG